MKKMFNSFSCFGGMGSYAWKIFSVIYSPRSLIVKIILGYGWLYLWGGFDQPTCAIELYSAQGSPFLTNYVNITGGAIDYQAAEMAEAFCNHYGDVLGVEYYDLMYNTITGVAHSCALDAVAQLPHNWTSYFSSSSNQELGELFVYHGYMGNITPNIMDGNFSEWRNGSAFIVRPVFANNTYVLRAIGEALINKYQVPVGDVTFISRDEILDFTRRVLEGSCSSKATYCYQMKSLYAVDLHDQMTFVDLSHNQMVMRPFK